MIDIKSLTLEELQAELKKMGQPSFRAGQIFKWLHEGVKSFDEMTNISKSLREELGHIYPLQLLKKNSFRIMMIQ